MKAARAASLEPDPSTGSLISMRFGSTATQLNPTLADAYRWLGYALLSLGRFEDQCNH